MELTTKQVHEAIDKILPFFVLETNAKMLQLTALRQINKINPDAVNQVDRVFKIMQEHQLIKWLAVDLYKISEFGKEVLENGGWLKYFEEQERQKQTKLEIDKLTLEHLKRNIFQIKYWWLFLLLAAVAGGLFGELFDYLFSKINQNL